VKRSARTDTKKKGNARATSVNAMRKRGEKGGEEGILRKIWKRWNKARITEFKPLEKRIWFSLRIKKDKRRRKKRLPGKKQA